MKPDLSDRFPYRELTYKIIGALFKVQNVLGNSLEERYYQRALVKEFTTIGLRFFREREIEIRYDSEHIGKHKVDFLVENSVILEIKTIPEITSKTLTQLVGYLKTTELRVGILANFRTQRLTYRRVINPLIR